MNVKQKHILNQILNINYKDVPIGKEFQVWLKTCEYLYTRFESIKDKDKKEYLIASHKIIYEAILDAEKIGYQRIPSIKGNINPENVDIIVPEFLEHVCKELCDSLLKFYKFIILRKLFSVKEFCMLIIKFYVEGTKIGGKENRGWGSSELLSIVNFMMKNIDLMETYAFNVIYLGTNGKIVINDIKKLDNLGLNIHTSYSMNKAEKMNREVEEFNEKRIKIQHFENDIKKGIEEFMDDLKNDDYSKIPPKSIDGNQCEDKCVLQVWSNKWGKKPVCACNVRKQGWLGSYLEAEKCNTKNC